MARLFETMLRKFGTIDPSMKRYFNLYRALLQHGEFLLV